MKHILAVLMLMVSMSASAIDSRDVGTAGFDKLSATEKAQIVANVEQIAKGKAEMKVEAVADKVDRWVGVGANIGKGLSGAAKELGVAVNDFSKTSVGQLVTFMLVFHFLGPMVIHVVGGLLVWIVGLSFIYFLMSRAKDLKITYDKDTGKKVGYSRSAISMDAISGFWFAQAAVVFVGLLVMFSW